MVVASFILVAKLRVRVFSWYSLFVLVLWLFWFCVLVLTRFGYIIFDSARRVFSGTVVFSLVLSFSIIVTLGTILVYSL